MRCTPSSRRAHSRRCRRRMDRATSPRRSWRISSERRIKRLYSSSSSWCSYPAYSIRVRVAVPQRRRAQPSPVRPQRRRHRQKRPAAVSNRSAAQSNQQVRDRQHQAERRSEGNRNACSASPVDTDYHRLAAPLHDVALAHSIRCTNTHEIQYPSASYDWKTITTATQTQANTWQAHNTNRDTRTHDTPGGLLRQRTTISSFLLIALRFFLHQAARLSWASLTVHCNTDISHIYTRVAIYK